MARSWRVFIYTLMSFSHCAMLDSIHLLIKIFSNSFNSFIADFLFSFSFPQKTLLRKTSYVKRMQTSPVWLRVYQFYRWTSTVECYPFLEQGTPNLAIKYTSSLNCRLLYPASGPRPKAHTADVFMTCSRILQP